MHTGACLLDSVQCYYLLTLQLQRRRHCCVCPRRPKCRWRRCENDIVWFLTRALIKKEDHNATYHTELCHEPIKINQSINQSVCLSVCLSVYMSVRPSVRPSIHPSIHSFIHSFIHPSIHPSIHSSIYKNWWGDFITAEHNTTHFNHLNTKVALIVLPVPAALETGHGSLMPNGYRHVRRGEITGTARKG